MRIWMKSLSALVIVTVTGYVLDRVLRFEGVSRQDLLLLSDALVGFVAAALVYVVANFQEQHSKFVAERLKIIAEMNHHIRNALQVIAYHSWVGKDEQELAMIRDAMNRITWALKEVLPQLPAEGEAALVSRFSENSKNQPASS
jgi:hypothetical protein